VRLALRGKTELKRALALPTHDRAISRSNRLMIASWTNR
jgi:hypothetical protein